MSGEFSRTLLAGNTADDAIAQRPARSRPGFTGVRRPLLHRDPEQRPGNSAAWRWKAVEVARRMGMPLVATSDAHYVRREDAEAQDVLLVHQHRQVPHRHEPDADGGRPVLPAQPGGNVRGVSGPGRRRRPQSQEIADSVDIELELGKRHFPTFQLPPEQNVRPSICASCAMRACASAMPAIRDAGMRSAVGELSDDVHRAAGSRAGRDQQAGLSELLPDRVGFRALRARAEAFRPRPAARASARWCATRCI